MYLNSIPPPILYEVRTKKDTVIYPLFWIKSSFDG
uniref:Uncharacterized protein n=1 Tax=Setaria italica TaxID=4555 RepID=K3ZFM4_SETIT